MGWEGNLDLQGLCVMTSRSLCSLRAAWSNQSPAGLEPQITFHCLLGDGNGTGIIIYLSVLFTCLAADTGINYSRLGVRPYRIGPHFTWSAQILKNTHLAAPQAALGSQESRNTSERDVTPTPVKERSPSCRSHFQVAFSPSEEDASSLWWLYF